MAFLQRIRSGVKLNVTNQAPDGRFSIAKGDTQIEMRVSFIPGSSGESIVMRLLDPSVASFSIENLHLNSYIREVNVPETKMFRGN